MLRARLAILTLMGSLAIVSGCASTSDRSLSDRLLHPFQRRSPEEGVIVSVSPPIDGPVLGQPPTFVTSQPTRVYNPGPTPDNNVPPLQPAPGKRLEPKAQPIPYVP